MNHTENMYDTQPVNDAARQDQLLSYSNILTHHAASTVDTAWLCLMLDSHYIRICTAVRIGLSMSTLVYACLCTHTMYIAAQLCRDIRRHA